MSISSEDIFHSSADYYTEFRKPYPQRIFDLVRDRFQLDGQDDLPDVGCGTGHIALPLDRRGVHPRSLYTTPYCNRDLLGDRVGEFEGDMARELRQLSVNGANGTFVWSPGMSYIFARKRV